MGSLQNYNGTVSRGAKKGSSGVEKPIGIYPGQYWDSETGLHYNYYRDYNPSIGRYIEADPIGIVRGRNHLFVIVSNTPVNKQDPTGLEGEPPNSLPIPEVPNWLKKCVCKFSAAGKLCCEWEKTTQLNKCLNVNDFEACQAKAWAKYAKCIAGAGPSKD